MCGKERDVLRHVADVALMRRQIEPLRRREHDPIADGDRAGGRTAQAGDRIEDRGLAGARRSEQRGDPGAEPHVDRQLEVPLLQRERERDHARGPLREVSRVESHSAPNAIAADTISSAAASRSRPVSANE